MEEEQKPALENQSPEGPQAEAAPVSDPKIEAVAPTQEESPALQPEEQKESQELREEPEVPSAPA